LEIGYKFFGLVSFFGEVLAGHDLITYGQALMNHGARTRTLAVAIDASFVRDRTIPIRAAKSRVQRDLLNTLAE
jgi:hypothetical protein